VRLDVEAVLRSHLHACTHLVQGCVICPYTHVHDGGRCGEQASWYKGSIGYGHWTIVLIGACLRLFVYICLFVVCLFVVCFVAAEDYLILAR
jgi:hypothetical protein